MAITFSEDQLKVIKSRDKNLLVSAAAGSGKTSVLVERIIRRITDPVSPIDIDRILVVTFTHAAAAEMKEKIIDALEAELFKHPDNSRLVRQSTLIHNAEITTIDSFCLDVLKENFHSINVDPSFRVANTGEIKLLKEDALSAVLDRAYEEKDPDFYNLIDCYVKKDKDSNIEESILKLYEFAMSYPWPEKWLNDNRNDYFFDDIESFKNSDLLKRVDERILHELSALKPMLDKAYDICTLPAGPNLFIPTVEGYLNDLECFIDTFKEGGRDALQDVIRDYKAPLLTTKKSDADKALSDSVRRIRGDFNDSLKDLRSKYLTAPIEEEYESMLIAGKNVSMLTKLTLDFKAEFEALKRDRGVIDFSDMEHMAVDILIKDYEDMDHYTVTDVAKEYQKRFDEVMIDEYQDSNLVQEIILAAVSHQGTDMSQNRFMVGDVKQSIYRFRLARPQIFMHRESGYNMTPDSCEVIHLKENYRSRTEVVDSVNAIFEEIMNPELGGIPYTENERLYAKADYPNTVNDNTSKLILTDTGKKVKKYVKEMECACLADIVEKLIASKREIYDKKEKIMRPVRYKDIAVLLRAPSNWRKDIGTSFDNKGIPFFVEGMGKFYEAKEIQDIINFLRIVDNPLNDIALFGAFTSFFGKGDNSLAALVKGEAEENEYYLYEKMKGFNARHPENKIVSDFLALLDRYRKLSVYTPISELITHLVTESGFLLYNGAKTAGKQKEANIELLIKKASDFSTTSFFGIFHFLRYIELMEKAEAVDEGEASIVDENADIVRIMSIHKSKGLEFPICIVMALEDSFNRKDRSDYFLADIDEGIGAMAIDPVKRTKRMTLKRQLIADKISDESLGEDIRVLYVALTRARDNLIMLSSVKDSDKFFESVGGKQGSYLDLIKDPVLSNRRFFSVEVVNGIDSDSVALKNSFDKKSIRNDLENGYADEGLKEEILDILNFEYPHKELEGLYIKTTVSNLKMAAMEEVQGETEELFKERERKEYIPLFAGGVRHISGTDRGSAYHALLALIDFTKEPSEKEWKDQFEKAILQGVTTKEELSLVNTDKLLMFAKTDMAHRMHKAALNGKLFKEQPFVMGVNAKRLKETFPQDENVLIQGVIDVFFEEDDGIVVLDYKTDNVSSENELVDRYRAQLDYYAEALTKLKGKSVTQKVLYSFGLNKNIVIE